MDTIADAHVKKKFEVEVIYNGIEKKFEVEVSETVKQLLENAIRVFSVTQQPHLLSLYTARGEELTNENQTIKEAGIHEKDKLLLRPSKVKGGL